LRALAHSMASDSADQALSRDVASFVICGKTWQLGDPIHSTGIGAIEKKMVQSFLDDFATARVEGVFMGRENSQKYRVKWTNYQQNRFLSTVAFTDSFRISPKKGL
jgi:hypothetical protein